MLVEVLFALDQIDEIALQGVGKFKVKDKEYDVIDAAKENVDLGEVSEEEKAEAWGVMQARVVARQDLWAALAAAGAA